VKDASVAAAIQPAAQVGGDETLPHRRGHPSVLSAPDQQGDWRPPRNVLTFDQGNQHPGPDVLPDGPDLLLGR
jgi:hypothetical protein